MATAARHGATPGLVTDDVLTADMAVRKAIPEYNQIFVDCAGAIGARRGRLCADIC